MKWFDPIKRFGNKRENGIYFPRMWRICVGDVNSFTELWSLRLTSTRLIGISIVVIIAIAAAGIALVVATPLRTLLPGYLGNGSRDAFETMAFRLDSLSAVVEYQNDYLDNISAVFNDEIADVEITQPVLSDSVGMIPVDSLLPTSDVERRFVKQYEQREKHNLSVLSPIIAEGMTFFSPVTSAAVADGEASRTDSRGITFLTGAGARVSSVYRGTVVATWIDPVSGDLSVAVQHPRDFFSVYTGMESLFVNKGDKVNAGSSLGVTRRSKPSLTFELWHNGSILNPRDYIAM